MFVLAAVNAVAPRKSRILCFAIPPARERERTVWSPPTQAANRACGLNDPCSLSQDALAHEAEVSRSYLSQLEKGKYYACLNRADRG